MASVKKRENEDLESLLRRFKRQVNEDGILSELKKREYHMTKSQKRRAKQEAAAAKRRKQARIQARFSKGHDDE